MAQDLIRDPDRLAAQRRTVFLGRKTRTPAASVVPAYQRLGAQNGSWSCPTGGGFLQGEIFYLGTEERWRATSYQYWADAACRFLAARQPAANAQPSPAGGRSR